MFEKPLTPGTQLLCFVCIYICTLVFSGFIIALFLLSDSSSEIAELDLTDSTTFLLTVFVHQAVCFLGSFFIFLRITGHKFQEIVTLQRNFRSRAVYITIAIFLLAMPLEYGLSLVNESLASYLPMSELIEKEKQMNQDLEAMMMHDNVSRLFISLFVLALLPAVAEEFIFRGFLMSRLNLATGNIHFSVAISSVIFAALHFQPLKLLPMIFLAMCLGYLYHYLKDIKYSILLHFMVNASQILLFFFWSETA